MGGQLDMDALKLTQMKAIDALEILTRRVGFERNIGDKLFHSLIAGKKSIE